MAHEDKDCYNSHLKRVKTSAATTPEERASFAQNLLGRAPPTSCLPNLHNSGIPLPAAVETDADGILSRGGLEGGGEGGRPGLELVDTLREMHPDATGVFSFWSYRAGNRSKNRGMRLDYCLASRALVNGDRGSLHDAFVLDEATVGESDHCPVGAVLRLGDHYKE